MSNRQACGVSPSTGRKKDAKLIFNGNAIAFLLFGILSGMLLTSIIAATASAPASIGEITEKNQFQVGMWFRYDFQRWQNTDEQFYIITNITGVISAGATDGEPAAASAMGDAERWYTWDIKAYWLDGTEAVSLYNNASTGNFLWDGCAYKLFKGYQDRGTITLAIVNGFDNNHVFNPIERIFRPAWCPTKVKLVSNTWAVAYLGYNYQKLGTLSFLDSKLSTMYSYGYRGDNRVDLTASSGKLSSTSVERYIFVSYEADTGLLSWVQVGSSPTYIFMYLSEWSLDGSPVTVTDPESFKTPLPGVTVSPSILATRDYDVYIDGTYDFCEVNITSSVTTSLKSFTTKCFDNKVPLSITGDIVYVTVDVRGVKSGVKSEWATWSGTLDDLTSPNVTTGIAPNVNVLNETLLVTWNTVPNTLQYLVYVNGSFIDSTLNTYYNYHPSFQGEDTDYEIFIVAELDDGNVDITNSTKTTIISTLNSEAPPTDQYYSPPPPSLVGNWEITIIIFAIVAIAIGAYLIYFFFSKRK